MPKKETKEYPPLPVFPEKKSGGKKNKKKKY